MFRLRTTAIVLLALLVGVTLNYFWMSWVSNEAPAIRIVCALLSGGAVGYILYRGRQKR